jgi:hypothetical protein
LRDPRALAAAILRLAQNPDLRRSFGDAARRRVEQCFSLQACVDRYETLHRALGEANPPPLSEILSDSASEIRRGTIAVARERVT